MKLSQQQSIEGLLFIILGNQNTGWFANLFYISGAIFILASIINRYTEEDK